MPSQWRLLPPITCLFSPPNEGMCSLLLPHSTPLFSPTLFPRSPCPLHMWAAPTWSSRQRSCWSAQKRCSSSRRRPAAKLARHPQPQEQLLGSCLPLGRTRCPLGFSGGRARTGVGGELWSLGGFLLLLQEAGFGGMGSANAQWVCADAACPHDAFPEVNATRSMRRHPHATQALLIWWCCWVKGSGIRFLG